MGRDVTGLRVSAVKPKPTAVSKTSTEVSEEKAASVKEGGVKVSPNEKSNGKHDVLGPILEDAQNDVKSSKVEEIKSSYPEKSGVGMTPVENVQTKHIAKKSLDVAGDQHGCSSPIQAETPVLCKNTSPKTNVLPSPSSSKKKSLDVTGDQHGFSSPIQAETPVLCKNMSPKTNVLPSPSSSKKSQPNSPFISRKHLDDEDNWSTGSSTTASVRAARFKTTVPVAPKFSVSERLEKRKEFYTKLEEKHKALEAEKLEYEARNKEEEQAAIKQLRKAMAYKANPVPSFYYEGPPPKKELKKLPTTRAVSPKLGRRKSFGDAMSSSTEPKVACSRAARLSLGSYNHNHNHKQGSITPTSTPKKKGPLHLQNGRSSLSKERPKQQAKSSPSAPAKEPVAVTQNITEQISTNISVQS